MRGFDIKQIRMRSFRISGLTAKWGIGDSSKPTPPPSIWDNNLVAWWDARTFPDGDLATIPNTATTADRAPDLEVKGAKMEKGTLQFDGVDDEAHTASFAFPNSFTVFWDVDWLGRENKSAGVIHSVSLYMKNYSASGMIGCSIRSAAGEGEIPNTSVGLSTTGNIYARDGSVTRFGGTVGTTTSTNSLYIAKKGKIFTQMGFRQLLIFNKELSQAEVNDVLRAMFPA